MNGSTNQACLLFGSNIAPEKNLPLAIKLLSRQVRVQAVSNAWESRAVGSQGPNFLNAAAVITTSLDRKTLKEQVLRPLETRLGRVRSADKNAPRTIDIDVVVWDGLQVDPELTQFAHIAVPVSEVIPDFNPDRSGEPLRKIAGRLSMKENVHKRQDIITGQQDLQESGFARYYST